MSLIPVLTLRRQSPADLSEFKANLFYKLSYRTARITKRNPCLKKNQTKQQKIWKNHLCCFCFLLYLHSEPFVNTNDMGRDRTKGWSICLAYLRPWVNPHVARENKHEYIKPTGVYVYECI